MNNELTAVLTRSPQLAVQAPLPVPAARVLTAAGVPAKARVPAKATDLRVDVKSTAPLVVHVSGEIDIATAPRLRDELLGTIRRHGAQLALDLSGVTFMDCAGISVLLAARRLARLDGGWVRVLQASHRAWKVLTLTGLHREFTLAGPETAGIA
jgi:anti-sigma B factor antagonist